MRRLAYLPKNFSHKIKSESTTFMGGAEYKPSESSFLNNWHSRLQFVLSMIQRARICAPGDFSAFDGTRTCMGEVPPHFNKGSLGTVRVMKTNEELMMVRHFRDLIVSIRIRPAAGGG